MKSFRSILQMSGLGSVIFGGICIFKRNEVFYSNILIPAFQSVLDAEQSHQAAIWALKVWASIGTWKKDDLVFNNKLACSVFGIQFVNPVGIAAGFDKNAVAITGLAKLGFGCVEVGSVTPLPQNGNDKPRVFRLSQDEAIINRYGFNSEGHTFVANEIKQLNKSSLGGVVIGVNLGKNKTSTDAVSDYVKGVKIFGPICDYLVINISSPNTPGLRSLQDRNNLQQILESVIQTRNDLNIVSGQPFKRPSPPILVKIAPDLTYDQKDDIAKVVLLEKSRVDGMIVCNTTVSRPDTLKSTCKSETGGLSGRPLSNLSTAAIFDMYERTNGAIPIIGVGGIFDGRDAYNKIKAGASLLQIYSSFTFHGPPVIDKINREICQLLQEDGYTRLEEAVGADHCKRTLHP